MRFLRTQTESPTSRTKREKWGTRFVLKNFGSYFG
jgi:hypothetical protein